MKLVRNANGDIKINSIRNIQQIFEHDNNLKNVRCFKIPDTKFDTKYAYFTTAFPWSTKITNKLKGTMTGRNSIVIYSFNFDLDILEMRVYIEDHYDYLPTRSAIRDFMTVKFASATELNQWPKLGGTPWLTTDGD
ncbi:hypothetical protein IWT25_00730 [Secundilactobacillus pentosiphilus]|uniref:Uncharacterized protein n=1 Tax=Secundilactobacillus pentosiphilus TaxID=1714682 RepID=A0A1Z5IUR8_9LACO|nr:hypothetical protein [Secundilactobacillus pentosiphilus]GAX05426.1 hypothetical protein IWT25_00730 [Secundilactobacillus pentosiphilus]